MATTAILTADHKTKSVTGTVTGSATWEDSIWCYNLDDPDEIYETVSVRYTSTYSGKVYGGMGEGGSFTMPLEISGSTSAKQLKDYIHEDCTHLNGAENGVVDTYAGKGTISGTATMGSMWTIQTRWVTDDGVVTVSGTYAGGPGWVK